MNKLRRRVEELEEALAASERRHTQLLKALDHLPCGVEVYDATGLASYLNPAMVEMTGLPSAEVALGRFNILTDPFSKETGLLPLYEQAYSGEVVATEEFAIEMERAAEDWGTGPKQVWFRMVLVPQLARDGTVDAVFAIMFETTEARRIANLLQLASRREGIELLAGRVAHDYNNLLSAIITNSELIGAIGQDEETRDMAEDILSASSHAVHLTRELMSCANPAAAQVRTADLVHLTRSIARVFRGQVRSVGAFHVASSDSPCLAEVNEGQLKQVIMNLLTNAMQALKPEGGQVSVTVDQVSLDAEELQRYRATAPLLPGRWNRIQVSDDGVGISPELQGRIFEPYFTTKATGQGLGLAAMLNIIEQHAGAVSVRSQQGEGSTFEVLIPLSARSLIDEAVQAAPTPSLAGVRAAVVDPTPFIRGSLRAVLEHRDCVVAEFASGDEAIDGILGTSAPPDIVLMEVMLPTQNGLDVLKRIRQAHETLPVVLLSTHVQAGQGEVRDDPMAVFVPKPFSGRTVLEAVAGLLTGS